MPEAKENMDGKFTESFDSVLKKQVILFLVILATCVGLLKKDQSEAKDVIYYFFFRFL